MPKKSRGVNCTPKKIRGVNCTHKKIRGVNCTPKKIRGVNCTPKKIRGKFIIITNVVLRLIENNRDTYYANYRCFSNQYHVAGMANVLVTQSGAAVFAVKLL